VHLIVCCAHALIDPPCAIARARWIFFWRRISLSMVHPT
jgi:hypothetical protein